MPSHHGQLRQRPSLPDWGCAAGDHVAHHNSRCAFTVLSLIPSSAPTHFFWETTRPPGQQLEFARREMSKSRLHILNFGMATNQRFAARQERCGSLTTATHRQWFGQTLIAPAFMACTVADMLPCPVNKNDLPIWSQVRNSHSEQDRHEQIYCCDTA